MASMKRQRADGMPQLPNDLGMQQMVQQQQQMFFNPSMQQQQQQQSFDPSQQQQQLQQQQGDQQSQHFDPSMQMGMGMGMGVGLDGFPCVKLRGLPFEVNEDDVRLFLGLDPVDILLVKRDGKFTGEAFVVLGAPMMVEIALGKHKMFLGNRFVEVFSTKKLDYYRAVSNEMGSAGFQAQRPRIQMGMGNFGNGMDGQGHMGGGGGGYGGAGFENNSNHNNSHNMGNNNHNHNNNSNMGNSGMGGVSNMGGGNMGGGGGTGGFVMGGSAACGIGGTTWIKMRGLPFSTSVDDIAQWYNEDTSLGISTVDPSSRVYIWTDGGRPTGMALAEFPSPQEATAALAKNKQNLGSRYIELFPATRSDLQKFQEKTGITLSNWNQN